MAPFFLFAVLLRRRAVLPAGAAPDHPAMPESPLPARASPWEWTRAALLSANLLWTALCLGGVLPGARAVTSVLTAALVAAHLLDPARGVRAHAAGWLFLPFLAYAACNVAWVTPVRWLGWTDWINWAQFAAVFWVVLNGLRAPYCRRLLCALLAGIGVLAGVLAAYQHFVKPDWIMLGRTQAEQYIGRSSGLFGIPNSLGVLMALLIPPVGYLAFQSRRPAAVRIVCGIALCALATGFVLAISRGAWFSLAAAFFLRALLSPGRRLGHRIAAAAGAVAASFAIAAFLYVAFPLMRERAQQLVTDVGERTRPIMWRGAFRIFEAHPVLGGGAGSFDILFEPYRPAGYRDEPVYAHCDYLNTLCDYGAVGFVLLFGPAAILAWRLARARGLAGAGFTGLLAFAIHLLVDFHLKIPALAMIVATVAALVTQEAWPGGEEPVKAAAGAKRLAAGCAAAAVMAFALLWALPKFRGDELRRSAREKVDRIARSGADIAKEGATLSGVRAGLARAVVLDPQNGQAWSDKAYADSLWAFVKPEERVELGVEASRDGERAVALCPVDAEFWIRRGMGLDMQHRWIDGGDCFIKALALAPMRADVWYYQAYHLSLAPNQIGPAMAAAEVSLQLDPGFLLAQSLRQRLETRLKQRS